MTAAVTAPSTRRAQILTTAARLFASRGFHGVSVAELGAACGISGPALYKHFPSKDAMLAEMLVSISEELLEVGRSRVAGAAGPRQALGELVDWHVDFALRHPELIVVQDRDWASLPDDARERVRELQLAYVDLWAAQVLALHRDGAADGAADGDAVSPEAATARVHATFGLINSTPHSALLPAERMRPLLAAMALGALTA